MSDVHKATWGPVFDWARWPWSRCSAILRLHKEALEGHREEGENMSCFFGLSLVPSGPQTSLV